MFKITHLPFKNRPDILIVICPMWDVALPHLGVSYLLSYLKSKNIPADILDINIGTYAKLCKEAGSLWKMENYRLWSDAVLFETSVLPLFDKAMNFYIDIILSQNVGLIGFSVNAANLLFSIEMARRIKARGAKTIIFGGPYSKWMKENINNRESYRGFYSGLVDIFVIGDGEKSLEEVIRRYKADRDLDGIAGVGYYKEDGYVFGAEESFIEDLDALPFPDFAWAETEEYPDNALPILMSRGCIRKCTFCNDTFIYPTYRCRSAENVFEEIKWRLENNSNLEYLIFNDLILNANLTELEKLCELMTRNKLKVHYGGQSAIRNEMDRRLLLKLRKSGCKSITYGVESFSNKVLKLMNKPYTYEDIQRVLRDTVRAGIETSINIVTGFPGEGEEEFDETVRGIKEASRYIKGISSLAPCLITLGSPLQRNLEKYKINYENAEDYFRWHSDDGNSYNVRRERARAVESLAKKLGLSVGAVNLYDTDKERKNKTEDRLSGKFSR